jgi:hypothetical protein
MAGSTPVGSTEHRAGRASPLSTRAEAAFVKLSRGARIARMLGRAVASTKHPLLVTLVVTRRCNLACGYCNEYDHVSQPVPTDALLARVEGLAELGTCIVRVSGGLPLLHPELDLVVGHIRRRGMIATVITNGFPLTTRWIGRLNEAGLDYLQISIDNVTPDDVSRKSLRLLDRNQRGTSGLKKGKENPEQAKRPVRHLMAFEPEPAILAPLSELQGSLSSLASRPDLIDPRHSVAEQIG